MICDVYTLGCLAKPCRCALMMLYLKTKNQKQSRLKLISVSYGGFFFFLGWTHDLSCTHPAQTKKKKIHLNVKAIVQSLEEETRQENANNDDWPIKTENKETVYRAADKEILHGDYKSGVSGMKLYRNLSPQFPQSLRRRSCHWIWQSPALPGPPTLSVIQSSL